MLKSNGNCAHASGCFVLISKYRGPTQSSQSCIIARAGKEKSRVVVPYNHELSEGGNHEVAILKLMEKLGWSGVGYVGASVGNHWAWVRVP